MFTQGPSNRTYKELKSLQNIHFRFIGRHFQSYLQGIEIWKGVQANRIFIDDFQSYLQGIEIEICIYEHENVCTSNRTYKELK